MYAKCGAVDNARKVFDEMPQRDIVSWNSMVRGYSSQGRWDQTSEFLERMRLEGFELNSVTSNTIICGLVYSSNHREALTLISQTRQRKAISALDSVSLLLGLKACSVIRYQTQGKEIHGLAIRSNFDELENIRNALITLYSKCHNIGYARIVHGFEHYLPIANSIVDMYCKSGRVSVAHKVFNMMVGHDKISYTALIAGYSSQRKGIAVRKLINEMISQGSEPDQIMIEVIRSVWSRLRNHVGCLFAWNHSSVAALVQHG
ncbi:hypothetical protein IEQ34_008513 [Dendrobium chrysotoxum]|uniref:Pentatricopeptide repeat-containing protein n=1 Tax=Dendrobium chrysotoxum TaxID=161865 RepID=A0AAV7GZ90_DENCH|nr:hypothetical protein IEQ34_008513 [Dendrobium chrysotoxum]